MTEIKDAIVSWLEDKESKFIFENRMAYNESGDFKYIKNIVDEYVPELKNTSKKEIVDAIKGKKEIWIWGGGIRGRRIVMITKKANIKVEGIIDQDPDKKELLGISVFNYNQVDFTNIDCLMISIKDKNIAESCVNLAIQAGIKKEHIILLNDFFTRVLEDKQYFEDFIQYDEGEIFVDAGALDLATSLRFAGICKRRGVSNYKIYAFEPDNISYQRCIKIRKQHPDINITLFNYGLWSSNQEINFDSRGTGGSRITESGSVDKIDVVSLDAIVKEKITYIKMDIEGAELEALKGCQNIIKEYRPKLAISVYHKREDIIEIPKYIKSLVPEYHLYFRHYSNASGETVLYALP